MSLTFGEEKMRFRTQYNCFSSFRYIISVCNPYNNNLVHAAQIAFWYVFLYCTDTNCYNCCVMSASEPDSL